MNFFYFASLPNILALPVLQHIQTKYIIIGVEGEK